MPPFISMAVHTDHELLCGLSCVASYADRWLWLAAAPVKHYPSLLTTDEADNS